jgi:hypothetical protein
VATSGPWPTEFNNQSLDTTWNIYQVLDAPLVQPLPAEPAVLSGVSPKQTSWLPVSTSWYDDPTRWTVELAAGGPANWPRVSAAQVTRPPAIAAPATKVGAVHVDQNSIRFSVSRTGTPVLVKISYFPNWHASGALGPWRVTPNLMVVVPTSHQVTLTYGTTPANVLGLVLTVGAAVILVVLALLPTMRRRRRRRHRHGGTPPSGLGTGGSAPSSSPGADAGPTGPRAVDTGDADPRSPALTDPL